jgi:hypothetical protein
VSLISFPFRQTQAAFAARLAAMAGLPADLVCGPCDKKATEGHTIFFCSACGFSQCADCWPEQFAHKKNILGPNGLPHVKNDPQLVASLRACMEAPPDPAKAHSEDKDTAWFGVWTDPENGEYLLQDQGRYASIMARSAPAIDQERYPKIVSFIGETGRNILCRSMDVY